MPGADPTEHELHARIEALEDEVERLTDELRAMTEDRDTEKAAREAYYQALRNARASIANVQAMRRVNFNQSEATVIECLAQIDMTTEGINGPIDD